MTATLAQLQDRCGQIQRIKPRDERHYAARNRLASWITDQVVRQPVQRDIDCIWAEINRATEQMAVGDFTWRAPRRLKLPTKAKPNGAPKPVDLTAPFAIRPVPDAAPRVIREMPAVVKSAQEQDGAAAALRDATVPARNRGCNRKQVEGSL